MYGAIGLIMLIIGLYGFFTCDLSNTTEIVFTWGFIIGAIACMTAAIFKED